MKKFRLMTSQCMGIFYRNFKLNKLLLIFMVVFLGIEYINLRTQKSYTSVAVLVVLAMFLTTFQSIIIINFANDRSNGFLDLYASMGLLKTPYILCQLISFALIHLIMQILIYLVYYLYYNRLDSLLPENFYVCLLFMLSLLPMVLIFSTVVRSPDYSRGLVILVNIFMYIYGFSYAWDNSNESVLALLMPHYHYSNFIISYYRQFPELAFMLRSNGSESNLSFFSRNPKISMIILFVGYLAFYLVLDKLFEELDARVLQLAGRFCRALGRCFKKRQDKQNPPDANKIRIEAAPGPEEKKSRLHWNNPNASSTQSGSEIDFEIQSKNYLVLRNIWKYFSSFPALSGVNIALKKGEVTCLLGHNGAGKSTLINILTGFLHPSEGQIFWDDQLKFGGKNQGKSDLREVGIGICTSKDILYESMTVHEHLKLACFVKGIWNRSEAIAAMIRALNLGEFEHKKVAKLSGGCRRKLSIGLALIGDPQIVFLDEPTSALDPVSRQEILRLLAKLKVER